MIAAVSTIARRDCVTPATRGLLDARAIASMKSGAVLVNTARGGVVDEAAVAASLRSGHLGGAALDVFDAEPLPAGSPLAGAPNLILTPHIAGVTAESFRKRTAVAKSDFAALKAVSKTVLAFTEHEGFPAHGAALSARLESA